MVVLPTPPFPPKKRNFLPFTSDLSSFESFMSILTSYRGLLLIILLMKVRSDFVPSPSGLA